MRISNRTPPPSRGNRLAEAMRLRGWNKQTALAEALGVKPSAISRWLKSGSLSLDHAIALCDFLNVSLDWLMLGRGMPEPGCQQGPERVAERTAPSIQIRAADALAAFTAALPELFGAEQPGKRVSGTALRADSEDVSDDLPNAASAAPGVIEVALRNGQVIRLSERLAAGRIAQVVEALEASTE